MTPIRAPRRRAALALRLVARPLVPVLVPVLLLWVWERLSANGSLDPTYFPPPSRIWDALERMADSGVLRSATTTTITRTVIGWLIAAVVGTAVGIALGRSPRAAAAFTPTFEFLRAVPAAAVVPAAVLLLGVGSGMEVTVVAFASVWPVLLNARAGVESTEPLLVEAARVYRLTPWQQATRVQLRSAMPSIVLGLRISLSVSLIVAVIAEMVASNAGLGNLIVESRSRFRTADVYALVAVLGVIGVTANQLLWAAERRSTRWQTAGAVPRR